MTVEPTRRFRRDVRGIGSAQIRRRLDQVIQELIEADNITEVTGVSRLRADGQHYRIRIGDYRSGNHNGWRDGRPAPFPCTGAKSTATFRDCRRTAAISGSAVATGPSLIVRS